jgi:hypothetical protein
MPPWKKAKTVLVGAQMKEQLGKCRQRWKNDIKLLSYEWVVNMWT